MDLSDIFVFARVVFKEVWINKFKVIISGAIAAFSILLIGVGFPTKYETSMTMYADNQNILKPLLEKQARMPWRS